jgi:hypothetical protein
MNDILHANIFFIITAFAVVVLTIFWIVILWYVIGIVREVRTIARRLSKASENIEKDLNELRFQVRSGGARVRSLGLTLFEFLVSRLSKPSRRSQNRRPKMDDEESDLVE